MDLWTLTCGISILGPSVVFQVPSASTMLPIGGKTYRVAELGSPLYRLFHCVYLKAYI